MNLTTWNMQGAGATSEVKWQTGVLNSFQNKDVKLKSDIMCLQECGPFPDSAKAVKNIQFKTPDGNKTIVQVFSYGGSIGRPWGTILFHEWDTKGGRVNTALVFPGAAPTDDAAIKLIWPAGGATWRPSLGVKQATGWVFSFHAISPKGPDAAEMLKAIAGAVGSDPWVVAADWNQEPGDLKSIPGSSVICPPNMATYPTKAPISQYDFLIRSGATKVIGNVTSLILSDHLAVTFAL